MTEHPNTPGIVWLPIFLLAAGLLWIAWGLLRWRGRRC